MREIKFKRAHFFDKEKTKFSNFTEWGVGLNHTLFMSPVHNNHAMYFEDLQFIGIKDKNGKEIYDGHILKDHGIVAWNDIEHKWSAIDLNWNDKREWHSINYLTSPFEIIGNIFENKELLK